MPEPRTATLTPPTMALHASANRLVARIADGDPSALAELERSLRSPVCNTVAVHIRDARQLRAVIAATFVEVWQMAGATKAVPGHTLSWILSIAERRAIERCMADAADPLIRELADVHDQRHVLELHRHIHSERKGLPASG